MWQSYYRSSLMRPVALEEFTVESDDKFENEYDKLCNTFVSNKGYWNKMCKNGLSKKILESEGWRFKETHGKNSYIFMKNNRVLKIQRQNDMDHDSLCTRFLSIIENISKMKAHMGRLLPTIYKVIVCKYNKNTNLMILMSWAGYTNKPMDNVSEKMISNAAKHLAKRNIFSLDVFTPAFNVNHGNLAFKVSKNGSLIVKFIDIDNYSEFKDSSNVPRDYLEKVWIHIIKKCLKRPSPALNYMEYEKKLSSILIDLF